MIAVLASLAVALSPAQSHPKVSPFEAIRWPDEVSPEVQVRGHWYELVALEGHTVGEILKFCHEAYAELWRKRFEEDLFEVLVRMGDEPDLGAELELVDLETDQTVVMEDVAMTPANREAIRRAASGRQEQPRPPPPSRLTREQAAADLEQLETEMRERFSYFGRGGAKAEKQIEKARKALGASVPRDELMRTIAELLAPFGDGHAGLREDPREWMPGRYAPFLLGDCGAAGVVAFHPDRSALLDERHPFLAAIDGKPLSFWLEAAARYEPRGSDQYVRYQALRNLRHLEFFRDDLGRPGGDRVELTLTGPGGRPRREVDLSLIDRRPVYGDRIRRSTGLLEGNIGYLRIASMDSDRAFLDGLTRGLDEFRATDGLILDVRGNGGGSRVALRTLFPYFLGPEDPPRVVNVAALRVPSGSSAEDAGEELADRWLYPASAAHWDEEERAAILAVARRFRPEWKPPAGQFSDWHYMVLSRKEPAPFTYAGDVVVLMDGGCFSATDIFLGAFQGHRGVTLLGAPSSGGSGRSRGIVLAHSKIELRLSSMASFQPDGRLYDGNGILPDRRVDPAPGDFVGASDAQLDAALQMLRD